MMFPGGWSATLELLCDFKIAFRDGAKRWHKSIWQSRPCEPSSLASTDRKVSQSLCQRHRGGEWRDEDSAQELRIKRFTRVQVAFLTGSARTLYAHPQFAYAVVNLM
jgi:hypothetical protein